MKDYNGYHDWILTHMDVPDLVFRNISFSGFASLSNRLYSVWEAPVSFESESDMLSQLSPSQKLAYEKLDDTVDTRGDGEHKGAYGQQEHFHFGWKMSIEKLAEWKRIWTDCPDEEKAHENGLYFSRGDFSPEKGLPSIKLGKTIRMSMFSERHSGFLADGAYALCVNMPYEYYSEIYTWDNFLCRSRKDGKLWSTGTWEDEMMEMLADVAENGIQEPLTMKIDDGTVISTKDCYGRLLCAMWLKLPTIPTILYIKADETDELESLVPRTGNKELANSFCAPEMIFP